MIADRRTQSIADAPTQRVVLLGASNLARSLPDLLDLLPLVFPEQKLDILIAHGHGRSYGQASSVPGRTLPAILECGLWRALEERPTLPTYALVTDVGNDLAYGYEVETIQSWVAICLKRLARQKAELVLTGLPVTSLARLEPWMLQIVQQFFFPLSARQTWLTIQQNVWNLERRLRDLANNAEAGFVEQHPTWYGTDPIHIRGRAQWQAFSTYFSSWGSAPPQTSLNRFRRWRSRIQSWAYVPQERRFLGIEQTRGQPSVRLEGGGILSLF